MAVPRHNIERERALPLFGQYRLDWAMKWLIALVCGLAVLALASSMLNIYGLWLPIAIMSVIFWTIFIFIPFARFDGRSLLSWIYRRARHDMGEEVFRSDRVGLGESLLSPDKQGQPKKFSKHLGKIDYIALQVAKGVYIGVAHDRRDATYTVGLTVKTGSLLTESTSVREIRILAFGSLLDRVASAGFDRFSWKTQVIPGEALNVAGDVEAIQHAFSLRPHAGHEPTQFITEYEKMVGESSSERLITFFFTISDRGSFRRRARKLEGGFPQLLVEEVSELISELGLSESSNQLGVKHITFLSYNELLIEARMALDPVFMVPVYRNSELLKTDKLFRESISWPQACSFKSSDHAIVGETIHCGFFVDNFPLEGVGPVDFDWLLNASWPMTVTAVYQPVPRLLAINRARRATNSAKGVVDELLAEGKTPTEAQKIEAQQSLDTQRKIVESLAEVYRQRVYVDVTGTTLEAVSAVVDELRNMAARNDMPVAGLNLREEDGVSVLLPVGRGLASSQFRRWFSANKT